MPTHDMKGSDFISTLIADSTQIHTQLLAEAMSADSGLQVVASASTSAELLAAVVRVPVDVAVISYSLDDKPGRGAEVLREMRGLRPQIKGILLMDTSRPQDVLECFRAGARGIFAKHERLESLSKCIRCVYEGQIWARSVELDHALEALVNSPLVRAINHKGLELLSERERQVVQYLAAGMTNLEIAESLSLSKHTIKNYLFRIFDKLGVSSRTELLYLTMSGGPERKPDQSAEQDENKIPSLLKSAESGHAWAQIQLADYYSQPGKAADPTSAYMWCLLSQESATVMRNQIESRIADLSESMSAEDRARAETRATEWRKKTEKKSRTGTGDSKALSR